MVQFFMICLAGYHKVLAWIASLTFIVWLWYFIDLHRIRYSHAGQVCFGDLLPSGSGDPGTPYLISEGTFFRYMIISQWLLLGLFSFGLLSSLIVVVMAQVTKSREEAARKKNEEIEDSSDKEDEEEDQVAQFNNRQPISSAYEEQAN